MSEPRTVLEEALRAMAAYDTAHPGERDRAEWWMPMETLKRLAVGQGYPEGYGPDLLLGRPINVDDTLSGLALARLRR